MSTLCLDCRSLQGKVNHKRNDYGHAKGDLVRFGSEWAAKKVQKLKAEFAEAEAILADHQETCPVAQTREPPKPQWPSNLAPAPRPKKRGRAPAPVVIDREAMAAALDALDEEAQTPQGVVNRGTNHLPSTGRCHECDRAISGERRFCGRCLARRSA